MAQVSQFVELPDRLKIYLPLRCTLRCGDLVEVVWHDQNEQMRWFKGVFIGHYNGVLADFVDFSAVAGENYAVPITVAFVQHNRVVYKLPADARIRPSEGVRNGTLVTEQEKFDIVYIPDEELLSDQE